MKRNVLAISLLWVAASLIGCTKQSNRSTTAGAQQAASGTSVAVARNSAAASIEPTNTTAQNPTSENPTATPTQTTAVQRPKIIGITDSDHNATAFAGTVVLNECGTVGKPEDCKIKDVTVPLTSPECDPDALRMARQNGWPDSTACHPNIGIRQLTLKLADGSYMALAPAFSVIHDKNDVNPSLQMEEFDSLVAHSIVEHLFDVDTQYPFNRYRDTASYTYYLDRGKGEEDKSPQWRVYFLIVGECASLHECQDAPQQRRYAVKWWKSIAPWEWEAQARAEQAAEREQERLNTAR